MDPGKPTPAPTPDPARQLELMRLMAAHQPQILAYLLALVPNRADAQDLLQETSVVLWDRFGEFQPGTDFVAWACRIAWWRVRAARQRFARSRVVFDDTVLEAVSRTAIQGIPEMDRRHEALAECLGRLPERYRELLMNRYQPGGTVEEAARRSGRTVETAYKALHRLRRLLLDCISHQLTRE